MYQKTPLFICLLLIIVEDFKKALVETTGDESILVVFERTWAFSLELIRRLLFRWVSCLNPTYFSHTLLGKQV